MIHRNFAIALLERCYAISGILNNSLNVLQASEHLKSRHPPACRAVGWLMGEMGDLLLEPTWHEYPDLQSIFFREIISQEPREVWSKFKPSKHHLVSDYKSPANFSGISHDTALRLFTLYESCYWQLNFIYDSAKKHKIPELVKIRTALKYVSGDLFYLLIDPLISLYPNLSSDLKISDWPIKPKTYNNSAGTI